MPKTKLRAARFDSDVESATAQKTITNVKLSRPKLKRQSKILRCCQKSARRFGTPLLDAILARAIARACTGLDWCAEIDLASKLAALSEREEVQA